MEQTHCKGPIVSCKIYLSRTVPSKWHDPSTGFPPPSYQPRLHVICADLVARRHFQLWHITTLISEFASASRILWSIDLRTGQDSMSNRVEQHQDTFVIFRPAADEPSNGFTHICARSFDDVHVVSRTSFQLGLRKNDKVRHDIFFFVIPSAS